MDNIFLIIAVLVGIVLIFLAYLLIKKESKQKSNLLIGFLALLGVVLIAFPVFSSIQLEYGDLKLKLNRLEEKITEIKDSTDSKIIKVKQSSDIANKKVNNLQAKLRDKQVLNNSDIQQLGAQLDMIQQPHH